MTKKSKFHTKFFAAGIVILTLSLCITSGVALNGDFTFDLDEFKREIQASPDECWKKPAQNRKDTICNKLTALQDLINEGNFEEAYDKLLHDIKPKLTGLKEDENEEPWGDGVFKQAWVNCERLREIFNTKCNLILSEINPLSVNDDDKTPPIIDNPDDIQYVFQSTGNTITWIATDDHPDTYTVLLGSTLYESGEWESGIPLTINIDGLLMGSYEFTITVYDTYGNFANDAVLVTVHEDDNTPPVILDQYDGCYVEDQPGNWKVYPWDEESGLGEVYITLSFEGDIYYEIQENLGGIEYKLYAIPLKKWAVGIHTINVVAKNDINYDGVQETSEMEKSVEIGPYVPPEPLPGDDHSPPRFTIFYEGGYTGENPGTWSIHVKDYDSGLDEVLIEVDGIEYLHDTGLGGIFDKIYWYIPVPSEAGIHVIKVTAINDIAYDGVQETGWKEHSVEIYPIITITYTGSGNTDDPGYWPVSLEDPKLGIWEVVILIDGVEYINENLGGVSTMSYPEIPVPSSETTHTIEVKTKKGDNYPETYASDSVQILPGEEPPLPPVVIG